MAGKGVEELYKNYGILADAGEKISEHKDAFEAILSSAKGSTGEKRLVAMFITKFSRHFPDLADTAMDAMLDLVEDEEAVIRHGAIKCLPELCRGSDGPSQCTKVADVLTQLLVSEDPTDIALVKTAMATVLQIDTQKALVGIFDQIMGDDETVREKAIAYVNIPLMDMRHILFIPKEENEKFLVECIRKVISDVTGEEFETFIEILGKLHHLSSTVQGIQQIVDIITDQAELQTDFQPDALETVDRFITCFRLALRFFKKGGSSYPFLQYVCLQMLPVLNQIPSEQEQHSVLQLMAEGSLYLLEEDVMDCLPFLYAFLLEHMPSVSEDSSSSPLTTPPVSGSPKLQFSVVECVLFTLHQLIRKCPEFLSSEKNSERLKEFRQRLQFFARGCQTYHGQLLVALKGKTALELKEEQNKLRQVAMKTTANISSLIKDFFHNPPSYKTNVQLSWGVKKVTSPLQAGAKRSTEVTTSGAGPAKRKPSPIRFSASSGPKKQTQEIYHPPRDQFSKKAATNGKFPDFEYGGRGGGFGSGRGRGRGRGRGGRGWNRRSNRNWRQK